MDIKRKKTREIRLGKIKIGGENPITVQSMIKTGINNPVALRREVNGLIDCGCEIIRIAVTDMDSVLKIKSLIKEGLFSVPLVADIQFDHMLAIRCLEAGVDGIRINPGNIGGKDKTGIVIELAKKKNAAVRIGINSGSLDKKVLVKNRGNIIDSMVESALENARFFESLKFYNFKISVKASSVTDTIKAYQAVSGKLDYPLHVGVTEAGPLFQGAVKSSVGIGIILYSGIGDTIRVSLTDSSVQEVKAGYMILKSLNLRKGGIDLVSCPTCGRTAEGFHDVIDRVCQMTDGIRKDLKLAVMGCIVNGPGEAKDADLGIAFGKEKAAMFLKGKVIKRVAREEVLKEFEKELKKII
ncbi:MAG: flavodoxin-dependent (E)-4-hydroxy-3-methylbut-2-enyl-diphosphate synthase [Actinobacteria bacterium]|nr:flavodoxin-dependent (E)-4-hydroxy-3-methylbut-2-enyl-diphosphate synthase [Actinomycetota bacterium]